MTVCKAVSAIHETISMASNRGNGPLKLSNTKYISLLEIVLDGFGKKDPPVRNKLLVEVYILRWL